MRGGHYIAFVIVTTPVVIANVSATAQMPAPIVININKGIGRAPRDNPITAPICEPTVIGAKILRPTNPNLAQARSTVITIRLLTAALFAPLNTRL